MTSNMITVITTKDGTERVSNIVLDKVEAWAAFTDRIEIFVGMHIFTVVENIEKVDGLLRARFGDN